MIAVETVIRKLVSEFEFVIIPGFGALLSHQVPASYDNQSGQFSPPVKKLAFNEFLKLDDGMLANYISREEKIAHLEAVAYVKQYSENLKLSLQESRVVQIDGIGNFKTNVEGKLIFEPNTDNYFTDEWYGFKSLFAKTFDLNHLHTKSAGVNHGNRELEAEQFLNLRKLEPNWVRWTSAAVIAGLMFFLSFFLVSNRENNRSSLNPFASFGTEKSLNDNAAISTPTMKRSSASIINKEKIKVTNIAAEGQPVLTASNKKFYVIAGAFKGTRQAKVLLAELQGKGFTSAIIIPSSAYSKKVKVAVQGYDSRKLAYEESAKLVDVIGETGWVFKKI